MHEINCSKDNLITLAACINAASVLLLNKITFTLLLVRILILKRLLRVSRKEAYETKFEYEKLAGHPREYGTNSLLCFGFRQH